MVKKRKINPVILTLLIGVIVIGIGFSGSSIYNYFFNLDFKNIDSATLNNDDYGILKDSKNYDYSSLLTLINNSDDNKHFVITRNQSNSDYVLTYISNENSVIINNLNVGIAKSMNPNLDFSSCDNSQYCNNNTFFRIDDYLSGHLSYTHKYICGNLLNDTNYKLDSYTTGTNNPTSIIRKLTDSNNLIYDESNTNGGTLYHSNYYKDLTCKKIDYGKLTLSLNQYDNLFYDSSNKQLLSLWTNKNYNNGSDIMSFVINKNTQFNNYEMYLTINNKKLYLKDLIQIDSSNLNNNIKTIVNNKLGNTWIEYGLNDKNSNVYLFESDNGFILIKSQNNNKFVVYSNMGEETLYSSTPLNSYNVNDTQIFSINMINSISVNKLKFKAKNFDKSTIVTNQDYKNSSFNEIYKLNSKTKEIDMKNFNKQNLNDFSVARFDDLLQLQDNLSVTSSKQNYKFGKNVSTFIGDNLNIINGSLVKIYDINSINGNNNLDFDLNNYNVNLDSNNIIQSFGTIYNYPNISIDNAIIINPNDYNSYDSILLNSQLYDLSSTNLTKLNNLNLSIDENVGFMFYSIIPNSINQLHFNSNLTNELKFNNDYFSNFIYLENDNSQNVLVTLNTGDLIKKPNLDISITKDLIKIK